MSYPPWFKETKAKGQPFRFFPCNHFKLDNKTKEIRRPIFHPNITSSMATNMHRLVFIDKIK